MANQIYCKHCGKLIDVDSSFCMHCGGEINYDNKTTPQANKQDVSFIRQLDILGGKFTIGILNIIKWCGRTIVNFGKFIKRHWKRILIFILGIAGAILLIHLGCVQFEEYRAMFIMPAIILIILTLYFSCSKSIKLILPSSILLLCSYGASIYKDYEYIYGANTTFFDTVKREFYWITPNFTIPDHVTWIGHRAFSGCDSLTSITFPNSVTLIGDFAFSGCTSLTSISIPNSVTSIGDLAFSGCYGLTSVNVNISDLARYCTSNPMHSIPGEKHLYLNGKEITNLVIPNSVTSIGEGAFSGCKSLTSATIPDSVTWIRYGAFSECHSLTSVTIPDSVHSIGEYAFWDCRSLTNVYCKAIRPPRGGGYHMFGSNATNFKIYVPRNSVKAYKSAEYWNWYAEYIVGYDF